MADKLISTNEAVKIIEEDYQYNITRPTIINWIEKYGIGIKIGGRWRIAEAKLRNFLEKGVK